MDLEKELFDLVEKTGEIINGDIHIIDQTEYNTYGLRLSDEYVYRVYHKSGYCFDTIKRVDSVDEDTDEVLSWEYDIFNEWDGFIKATTKQYIDSVRRSLLKK